ncbi:GNAT family N-acetyltransferase [Spongisporangium articulatum]|uniref:GNAT family N-acetyltransferase n=1 Tax=Spongisporangium articulatum TaxID=3362603 RepID=A0ABW8AMT2_9ACTN
MASTAQVSVRPATPGDAAAIAAVQSRGWRAAYAGLLPEDVLEALDAAALTPSWREAVLAANGTRNALLVAVSDDIVVGFATAGPSDDGDAGEGDGLLAVLVVDPAHQRAGHASRLLSAAADHLREQGLTVVRAWSPELDYARRTFLTSAGMEPDGATRGYLGAEGREVVELRLAASLGEP